MSDGEADTTAPTIKGLDDSDSIDRELDWIIQDSSQDKKVNEVEPEGNANHVAGESEDNEEYDEHERKLAEEQRLAELELQKMREEGYLPADDPPEYNMAARIRELNEQLAQEEPIAERNTRKIKFAENLVSQEIPPEEFEGENNAQDEEAPGKIANGNDHDDHHGSSNDHDQSEDSNRDSDSAVAATDVVVVGGQREINGVSSEDGGQVDREAEATGDDLTVEKLSLDDQPDGGADSSQVAAGNHSDDDAKEEEEDEKVLIERSGKFEMVSASELTAEERSMMGLGKSHDQDSLQSSNGTASIDSFNTNGFQPSPPQGDRPTTAPQRRRVAAARPTERSQSAMISRPYGGYGRSHYGLSPEEMELKKKQLERAERRRKEREMLEKEERERKRQDAEDAFQAWLERKKVEESERRKETSEQRRKARENETSNDPEEAFKAWKDHKKVQIKKDKYEKIRKHQEMVNGYQLRPREECEKAFREWLKRKNRELHDQQSLSRAHNLQARLSARKSRKSQNLSKALKQSQTYRYVDYYGYRF